MPESDPHANVWVHSEAARYVVLAWIFQERGEYADVKYADGEANRTKLVQAMQDKDWEQWTNFMGNYLKRAELFGLDTQEGRQAMGKAIVTGLHILETAICVWGDMPKPGMKSGEVEPWSG